jgi:hypothetical protein
MIAICALTGDTERCPHDRIEPMWDLRLREETGMPGPFALVTGAYTPDELRALAPARLDDLREHLAEQVRYHRESIEAKTYGAPNACERLHLQQYERDLAVVEAAAARV